MNQNQFAEDPSTPKFGEDFSETVENADQPAQDETTETDAKFQRKSNHQERRYEKLFNKLSEATEKLSELEQFKQSVEAGKYSSSNEPVPEHVKAMYADNISLEERWSKIRQYEAEREEKLAQQAEERVFNKINAQRQEQEKWEEYIDDNLEAIEEKYDVDFTSGSAKAEKNKKTFLAKVMKLSPKDDQGNVTSYAPFEDVFEEVRDSFGVKTSDGIERKKDIASLGGNSRPSAISSQVEAGEGGMWGWRKNAPD